MAEEREEPPVVVDYARRAERPTGVPRQTSWVAAHVLTALAAVFTLWMLRTAQAAARPYADNYTGFVLFLIGVPGCLIQFAMMATSITLASMPRNPAKPRVMIALVVAADVVLVVAPVAILTVHR